jgi:hypothetical protein
MADLVVECSPTDQECRALVQKIVASIEFRKATRLRDFLLYVVDRKLARAPQEVTESLIGQRVFGRPSTYNTGEDSIVRTEARLLRQRWSATSRKRARASRLCWRFRRDRMSRYFTDGIMLWRQPYRLPPSQHDRATGSHFGCFCAPVRCWRAWACGA